jgi:hydrophobic/amphiphilic exporter-1 (mainly G- bacteria), HAE1 family
MIMMVFLVLGLVSASRLSIDEMPDTDLPFVFINVAYPGANPETVEKVVIKPLEKAVNTVEGIDTIQSYSRQNIGFIFIEFKLGTVIGEAVQDVKDKSAPSIASFPPEVESVLVQRYDPTSEPVMSLALSSDTYTLAELTDIVNDKVIDRLQSVEGVGSVDVVGGQPYEVRVEFDPQRMNAAGIELKPLIDTLSMGGKDIPAGVIKTGELAYDVQFRTEPDDPLELGNLVLLTKDNVPICVKDVADVRYVPEEATSYAFVNGSPALGIDIRKSSGANTTDVADAMKDMVYRIRGKGPEEGGGKKYAGLKSTLPPGINLEVVKDNSTFIRNSVEDVQKTLFEGAILCVIVVFVFLVSWRSTIITGLTLPISIIGAFVAIYAMGFTLNVITLMALSLATGLLIDDAIVVRENIMRKLKSGLSHREASLEGTSEIGLAVLATTLTVMSVFIPMSFMGGIVGKIFYSFGITIAAAVAISLLVSFTLDPMLSAYWYDPQAAGGDEAKPIGTKAWLKQIQKGFNDRRALYIKNLRGSVLRNVFIWPFVLPAILVNLILNALHILVIPLYFVYFGIINVLFPLCKRFELGFEHVADNYSRLIGWVLAHRPLIVLITVVAFFSSLMLFPIIGVEFFPRSDRGTFTITIELPVGTNTDYTAQFARKIEDVLQKEPETLLTYLTVAGGTSTARQATIDVNMKPRSERKAKHMRDSLTMADDLRKELQAFPGAKISTSTGGMGPGGKTVSIYIAGPSLEELDRIAMEMENKVRSIPGAVDISRTEISGSPMFALEPREFRAAQFEYRETDLASKVYAALSGSRIGSWQDPQGLDHDIMLRLPERLRHDVNALEALPIKASYRSSGETVTVPLSSLATIKQITGPSEIQRYQLQRRITVECNVSKGIASGTVINKAKEFSKEIKLPPGYEIGQTGEAEMIDETINSVVLAMVLAILFIYFVLASQFESFTQPLAIMLSLPLSLVGVAVTLLLVHTTLNMMSMIGLILLMGLVTKNAILLIEFTNQLRRQGLTRKEALARAGRIRLRPIIMTTLAMIFGMLPLALALGEGGEMRAPMARAVIGGLITSTMLTLIVVPVAYSILDDMFASWKLKAHD